jgi:hypothetical protein
MTLFIVASFDTAPSPHRRINSPSLLLAFAHVQGEAGTPTGGVGSAVVGRNSPVLCVCRRGAFVYILAHLDIRKEGFLIMYLSVVLSASSAYIFLYGNAIVT